MSDALAEIRAFIDAQQIDTTSSGWKTKLPMPPVASFDPARTYSWELETNVGSIGVSVGAGSSAFSRISRETSSEARIWV